jgi:hypothetical protein
MPAPTIPEGFGLRHSDGATGMARGHVITKRSRPTYVNNRTRQLCEWHQWCYFSIFWDMLPLLLLFYLSPSASVCLFTSRILQSATYAHLAASGLLWLSEIIEEHSRTSKLVGIRSTYVRLLPYRPVSQRPNYRE